VGTIADAAARRSSRRTRRTSSSSTAACSAAPRRGCQLARPHRGQDERRWARPGPRHHSTRDAGVLREAARPSH